MTNEIISEKQPFTDIFHLLVTKNPTAFAQISGLLDKNISGYVLFFPLWEGTLVTAYVTGLPEKTDLCSPHFFAFHIHEGDAHYNPGHCQHPEHAGDFPPFLASSGFAWQMFYSGYITPAEIIGMSAVIHAHSDDFTSQPSGNPGEMIAKGDIFLWKLDDELTQR